MRYCSTAGYGVEVYFNIEFGDFYHPDLCRVDVVVAYFDKYRICHITYVYGF